MARSVYKLEEIDARHGLLKKKDRVLDFGCAPGSWLQYASEKVGERGFVLGYDIVEVRVGGAKNVTTFVRDIHDLTPEQIRDDAKDERPFNVVLSDMAPKTTGIRDADQARSIALVEAAAAFASILLTDDGVFAAKVFQGRGFDELLKDLRKTFKQVKALRPKATRSGSREAFLIARTLRKEEP